MAKDKDKDKASASLTPSSSHQSTTTQQPTSTTVTQGASSSSSNTNSNTKLTKFLHRSHHNRDRSRSLAQSNDSGPYSSSDDSSSSRLVLAQSTSSSSNHHRSASRKSSRLFGGGREKDTGAGAGKDPAATAATTSSVGTPSTLRPSSSSASTAVGKQQSSSSASASSPPPNSSSSSPPNVTFVGPPPTPTIIEPETQSPSTPSKESSTSSSNSSSSQRPRSPTASSVIARARTISISRPVSLSTLDSYARLRVNGTPGSPARLADISGRLSGWFSHTFSSSTTDLSLAASTSQPNPNNNALARSVPSSSSSTALAAPSNTSPGSPATSPKAAAAHKSRASQASATLMSHIPLPGKANIERAVRWAFDSDIAQPDRSTDVIWIMGLRHPGYEPPVPSSSGIGLQGQGQYGQGLSPTMSLDSADSGVSAGRQPSIVSTPPTSTTSSPVLVPTSPNYKSKEKGDKGDKEVLSWPPAFYEDFTSRIWLTYRSHYSPIRDGALGNLEPPMSIDECSSLPPESTNEWWEKSTVMAPGTSQSPPKPRWASWGGEKTWTSDTGWGCMLRTGQSVLAEALIHLHLGREWRVPASPTLTPEYATYVKILTWFFDTPSPLSPFGVHRMALAGKAHGKDVGTWFGPSTAAGSIKTLVNAFPEAGLSAAVSVDGTLYESDVYAASNAVPPPPGAKGLSTAPSISSGFSKRQRGGARRQQRWGGQAVLVLIGIRLGIDNVNPIYHDRVKALFTFPQSIGIAGGRPSSSYYFIGYQGDNLFYLDPHHTRPAVPLQPFTPQLSLSLSPSDSRTSSSSHLTTPTPTTTTASSAPVAMTKGGGTQKQKHRQGSSTSSAASSVASSGAGVSHRARKTDDPLTTPKRVVQKKPSTSNEAQKSGVSRLGSPPPASSSAASASSNAAAGSSSSPLDPVQTYYATAYNPSDLRTFHCDRVRKMPMSSLDPSMLLAFLCKDEADWKDLRARVADLGRHRAIFSIQDEPPTYGDESDSDIGMQSISDGSEEEDDLSSNDHTFESSEGDIVDLSEEMIPDDVTGAGGVVGELEESELQTPSLNAHTRQPPQFPSAAPSTPSPASRSQPNQPQPFPTSAPVPFPGSDSFNGDDDDSDEDDDEEWVTPSTPPSHMSGLPRRTHLRSQSLASPPSVRSPAITLTPGR